MNHTQFTRTLILCLFALLTIGHSSVPAQVLQLAELNTEQIRALDKENTIVLIPGGILEQHGPYLPSYTDGYRNEWATRELAQAIAARAAAAEERVREKRFAEWLTQQRDRAGFGPGRTGGGVSCERYRSAH
jgi:hypothetical protein